MLKTGNDRLQVIPFVLSPKAGIPNFQDLMPDDVGWNWSNTNRTKEHNRCTALESSLNHPSPDPWKNYLPWNQSLVPKRLGTAALRGWGMPLLVLPHAFLILDQENSMDGGAWQATVHGVTKLRTRLSDFIFTFTGWLDDAWSCWLLEHCSPIMGHKGVPTITGVTHCPGVNPRAPQTPFTSGQEKVGLVQQESPDFSGALDVWESNLNAFPSCVSYGL